MVQINCAKPKQKMANIQESISLLKTLQTCLLNLGTYQSKLLLVTTQLKQVYVSIFEAEFSQLSFPPVSVGYAHNCMVLLLTV